MIKSLTKHGNSVALVIERPILELLGANINTLFEITTDGKSLVLTPVETISREEKLLASMNKINKKYSKTFEDLAK